MLMIVEAAVGSGGGPGPMDNRLSTGRSVCGVKVVPLRYGLWPFGLGGADVPSLARVTDRVSLCAQNRLRSPYAHHGSVVVLIMDSWLFYPHGSVVSVLTDQCSSVLFGTCMAQGGLLDWHQIFEEGAVWCVPAVKRAVSYHLSCKKVRTVSRNLKGSQLH